MTFWLLMLTIMAMVDDRRWLQLSELQAQALLADSVVADSVRKPRELG